MAGSATLALAADGPTLGLGPQGWAISN